MTFRRFATGAALALVGLAAAVGIGLLANTISGESVGLGAEPLSAGETLAPAQPKADDRQTRSRNRNRNRNRGGDDGVRTTTTPTELAPPATTTDDDSGGSDDSSGSGSGSGGDDSSGRGRGRGGDGISGGDEPEIDDD